MAKIKAAELEGIILDWAVTSIECPEALKYGVQDWREQRRRTVVRGEYAHRYHQSWAQGGPIIEREGIELKRGYGKPLLWAAFAYDCYNNVRRSTGKTGPTPLVAAMRCYVASKLGDEVDVPDELIGN